MVASQQGLMQKLSVKGLCVSNQGEAEATVALSEKSHAVRWSQSAELDLDDWWARVLADDFDD